MILNLLCKKIVNQESIFFAGHLSIFLFLTFSLCFLNIINSKAGALPGDGMGGIFSLRLLRYSEIEHINCSRANMASSLPDHKGHGKEITECMGCNYIYSLQRIKLIVSSIPSYTPV